MFLFAALAIVWLAIVAYLVMLSGRIAALQRELDHLKHQDAWLDDEDRSDR